MRHQPRVLGSLLFLLAAGSAWGAVHVPSRRSRCTQLRVLQCQNLTAADSLTSAKSSQFDSSLNFKWKVPELHLSSGVAWQAPPSPTSIGMPEDGKTSATNAISFSPGQSTGEGQHIVEWTLLAAPLAAYALSPLIDHRLARDDHGIWKRKTQLNFEYAVILTEAGGALWFGGKSRIGKTFWQAMDASAFTAVTVQAMKYAFSRSRPYQANNPNLWFQGNCCQSFPSGEVSFQASFVTPFIAEYHKQYPWVWALEALPAYDALARMKAQGHWQTDVLAAWAIGTAWGLYAHFEPKPLILSFMPHGIMVGLHVHF